MKQLNSTIVNKMAAYFMDKLRVVPHNTGWLRQGTCPACSKEKKYGINLWMNRSNCFSCGYHPTPMSLLIKLEGLNTFNDAMRFINAFEGAEYLDRAMPVMERKEVKLPESFTLLAFGDSRMGNIARNYMKKRGYSIQQLTMKGVGYCTTGPYAHRIIIPFYSRGELIYFNARQYIMLGSKHKNPNIEEFGIGKAQVTYNVDALHIYSKVYILESATNCLTLGDNAMGTGGKIISDYQRSVILRSPCKNLVIILDPDAKYEAYKQGMELVNHKRVKVVEIPEEYKGKSNPDVNDLGKKITKEFEKKTPWSTYKDLYKRFLQLPKPEYRLPVA